MCVCLISLSLSLSLSSSLSLSVSIFNCNIYIKKLFFANSFYFFEIIFLPSFEVFLPSQSFHLKKSLRKFHRIIGDWNLSHIRLLLLVSSIQFWDFIWKINAKKQSRIPSMWPNIFFFLELKTDFIIATAYIWNNYRKPSEEISELNF